MILDYENVFSEDQAIVESATSTNLVDLGAVDSKVQPYNSKGKIKLVVQSTEAFDALTNLTIALRTSATKTGTTANSSLNGTVVTKFSRVILAADLIAGKFLIDQDLPLGMLRYCDLAYTVGGSNPSTGKISAYLALDGQSANVQGV